MKEIVPHTAIIVSINGEADLPSQVALILSVKYQIRDHEGFSNEKHVYVPTYKINEYVYVSQWPGKNESCVIDGKKMYFNRMLSKYKKIALLQRWWQKYFPVKKEYIIEYYNHVQYLNMHA